MKVVVSGGTGLIGQRLVQSLAADGHELIVLSRSPERYASQFSGDVTLVKWNGRDQGAWAQHVDGADAVVNLAGESISGSNFLPDRWTDEKKRRILQSRIDAGQALSRAVVEAEMKPGVLLQASAVGYYGFTGDAVITEASPAGSDFLARVTVQWEASTAEVEDMGVRRPVARIGLVLSTEDGALPRLLLPSRLFAGGWFGSGDQWWSWVHLADTVRGLRFLLENEAARGAANLTAPNPVTNKEFGNVLGEVMNRPSLVPVPAFALRIALGEVADTVLEGQRAMPQKLLDLGFTFDYPELKGALQNLINERNNSGEAEQMLVA